jgi:predicted transcriptional regulator of viral defense system
MGHNIMMNTKTLGKESAALFTGLASQGKMVFSIADAQKVSGKNYQATLQSLHRLTNAGWLVSSGSGVYAIVSPEAGSEAIPAANRLVIGRALVGDVLYYFSHDTALSVHNLITRPVPKVKISTPRRLKTKEVLKVKYNFIYTRPENIWGTESTWVSEGERISVSDPERTIIDSLARPDLSGGVVEVAAALKIGANKFDWERLIAYAKRFDNQAVKKRIGFLLELLELAEQPILDQLQSQISPSYALLEPYLPNDGHYFSRWKLKINIEPDILEKAAST